MDPVDPGRIDIMVIPNNTESDEDDEASDSDSSEQTFVEMLQNLISSGQIILQRDERHYYTAVKMPKIKFKPDTTLLDESEFSLIVKHASGVPLEDNTFEKTSNVTKLLKKREIGLHNLSPFTTATKCRITNNYVPNEMVNVLEGSGGKMFCGIFSPDGNTFLTASQDQKIKLFNSQDGSYRLYKKIKARDVGWSLIDVTFSPDGGSFVYSTWSSSLYLCNLNGNTENHEMLNLTNTGMRFCVFSVVYSSDGKELLCGANDGNLYIYDKTRQCRILKVPGHEYDVNKVLFADNSSQIIYSGGDDGLIKVWDRRALNEVNPLHVGVLAGHMNGITYIDSKGDGRYLISNSKDQSIKLWDIRKLSDKAAVRNCANAVRKQAWDYRWQRIPKDLYQDIKLEGDASVMTYKGHAVAKTLIRAKFSPLETTGQRYIYTGCGHGRVVIYDALSGKIVEQNKGHAACVRDVSWHPTRNEILSSSWDGLVGKWIHCKINDSKSGEEERKQPLRRSARLAALKMISSSH